MPLESKTNGVSSLAFLAAVTKCLAEEIYFLMHSCVDVMSVFSMMDKLSSYFIAKEICLASSLGVPSVVLLFCVLENICVLLLWDNTQLQ